MRTSSGAWKGVVAGGACALAVVIAGTAGPIGAQPLRGDGADGGANHADASSDVHHADAHHDDARPAETHHEDVRRVDTSTVVAREPEPGEEREDEEEPDEHEVIAARDASTSDVPQECREPTVAIDRAGHCCLPGQSWRDGRCAGAPASCPPGQTRLPARPECVARPRAQGDASVTGAHVGSAPTAQAPADMAIIPGGAFRVGATLVSLGPYAIDRHEVTAADYARCVAAGSCVAAPDPYGQTADRASAPVVNVTWEMARRYCAWAGRRLPTEAEWEFAARGVDGRRYPWGERVPQCDLARFAGCGNAPLRVNTLANGRSPFGLVDMAGNVAEWVADRMGSRGITGDRAVYDPTGPTTGSQRVTRGGSFISNPNELENGARRGQDPREGRFDVGFRCARGL